MGHQIVFLYTEIADYFVNACKHYTNMYPNDDIHIIKFDVNKEAPFQFNELPSQITFYNRNEYNSAELIKLVDGISPSVIITSGWVDRTYLKIAKKYKNIINTVLLIDNHWQGGFKQNLLSIISPFVLKNKFSHAWVPGKPQSEYAAKLGFDSHHIFTGFYCANPTLYNQFYNDYKKEDKVPKNLIVVARYIPQKNLEKLWSSFADLTKNERNDWEMICVGSGKNFGQRKIHKSIKHVGFVQPSDMGEYIKQSSVFILPSVFEPWGVAVHEFAIAGYPLLLSNKIGAATAMLEEGENGYSFNPRSENEIKKSLLKMIGKNPDELKKMGSKSREISKRINVDDWAHNLNKLCHKI